MAQMTDEQGHPAKCRYCGCEEVVTKTDSEIVFQCRSSYMSADEYWTVSGNCVVRCAVKLVKLRANVQQAVEVLEGATRYSGDLVENDQYGAYMQSGTNGERLDTIEVDRAIAILKGGDDGI